MAGGNLITYASSPSVRITDLDTAKLHWNSVISTKGAKYMCLDIIFFNLTANLEYFEYMRIPLELFTLWIQEQYNLKMLAYKGFVHLEMRKAVWGLPQAGILANKGLQCILAPFGYFEHISTPGLWYHETWPINCSNTVTLQANKSRIARTRLPQSNLVPRPRLHSPRICCLNCIKQVSKRCKR
jgi:hypothetical protein